MRKPIGIVLFALAAAVLARPTQARALVIAAPQDVPYEVVVAEADVIVTATVTSVPKPPAPPAGGGAVRPMPRRGMGMAGTGEGTFKVDKILANGANAELEGKEITVTFGFPGRAAPKVGDTLVLAIKKMEEGKYYVLPYANAYSANVDKATADIAKVADLDKWNWGKESNGLRAIALSRNVTLNPQTGAAQMQIAMAVRNTGKESVFLNTYPGDNTMLIKAFWDGTPVPGQLAYNGPAGQYAEGQYTVEIKPGAIAWMSQWGPMPEGSAFAVQSPEGKCAVQVVYVSNRDGTAPGGKKLWKGTLTSSEITVEVPKVGDTSRQGRPRAVLY